jgi:hypothetical protein
LVHEESYKMTKYDARLALPFDFVCKILNVSREDFASLAISNLLDEELDFIKNNGFDVACLDLSQHKDIVSKVKYEANGWVINRK